MVDKGRPHLCQQPLVIVIQTWAHLLVVGVSGSRFHSGGCAISWNGRQRMRNESRSEAASGSRSDCLWLCLDLRYFEARLRASGWVGRKGRMKFCGTANCKSALRSKINYSLY